MIDNLCRCGHPRSKHPEDGECCESNRRLPYYCPCGKFDPSVIVMKTIRVRIAVVINEDGDWAAFSGYEHSADASAEEAARHVPEMLNMSTVFVEADLPIPEPVTVQGTVRRTTTNYADVIRQRMADNPELAKGIEEAARELAEEDLKDA